MNYFKAVLDFHDVYGVPVGDYPQPLTRDRLSLRLRLIKEEYKELRQACGETADGKTILDDQQDVTEMADALGDIVYVCIGMAIEMGVNLDEVFAEIQRANMSKLKDGKPYRNICQDEGCPHHGTPHICDALIDPALPYDKVLKGPDYQPPNIKSVLDSQSALDNYA